MIYKYFWYLLGYTDTNNNNEIINFVTIEKPDCHSWKNLIETIKKDKASNDFPLHHDNEKLKIK